MNQPNNNQDPLQAAMVAQQQAAAANAMIDGFIKQTSMALYASLVGQSSSMVRTANTYRKLARTAKEAAPYLAEAYGMVRINVAHDASEDAS